MTVKMIALLAQHSFYLVRIQGSICPEHTCSMFDLMVKKKEEVVSDTQDDTQDDTQGGPRIKILCIITNSLLFIFCLPFQFQLMILYQLFILLFHRKVHTIIGITTVSTFLHGDCGKYSAKQ